MSLPRLVFSPKVLEQHLITLGKTGAGKSSALRHIVEHLLQQGKRVCIVDPKGDWWGLRASADGKGAGFPVVLFGDFKNPKASDVPINEFSGVHVAELIATGNRPAVIGFRGWMPGARTKFWIDFAAELFNSNAGELYFVGDEFHHFAPKGKVLSPQAGLSLHWSNTLLSEGRGIGLICLLASQRPQKVHNDTLTQCETLVAMRVVHKADRDAVVDWIRGAADLEQGQEILTSLASLRKGEAYVWSPEAEFGPKRVNFPMFTTFDSFAPPQLQKKVNNKSWADIDLAEVKEKLAAVIEEAEANDPALLNQRIRELEVDLQRAKETTQTVESVVECNHEPEIAELREQLGEAVAACEEIGGVAGRLDAYSAEVRERAGSIAEDIVRIRSRVGAVLGLSPVAAAPSNPQAEHRREAVSSLQVQRSTTLATNHRSSGGGGGKKQEVLNALAELESIGLPSPDRLQVALRSGYTHLRSTGFVKALSSLSGDGLISYPSSKTMALTPTGRSKAVFTKPKTSAELQEKVLEMVGGVKADMLRVVLSVYPRTITRDELMRKLGYNHERSTGFTKSMSGLSRLELIHYPDKKTVRASDLLFTTPK